MDRPAKIVCLSLLLVPMISVADAAPTVAAAGRMETVIYKHVDENGRVTYANSPIKGGARVDLEPLTVIPSTPSGSLNAANAQSTTRGTSSDIANDSSGTSTKIAPGNRAPGSPVVNASVAQLIAKPAQVASVLPLSNQANAAAKPIEKAPGNNVVASVETLQQLTQQRRAETRRRLLEGELQTEEQMLVSARSKLDEEQKLSGSIRAMRASFSATAEAVTPQKPLVSPETRAEIERHFERVRNLQDQVSMHENHLNNLREQLVALK